MNTDTMTSPDVAEFVAAVRTRLVDLPSEAQRDLTEGLEADLTDLVAEQGTGVLGDPDNYARELRVAAGFPAETGRSAGRRSAGHFVNDVLDAVHQRWDGFVRGLPGQPYEFLEALRPAWWIVRAWVAVQLLDLLFGSGAYNNGLSLLPTLGNPMLSVAVLLLAVLGSVALGQRKLWPTVNGAGGRVVLLGLNALAISVLPVVLTSLYTIPDDGYSDVAYTAGYRDGLMSYDNDGIYAAGKWISQIYPYDAAGKPLVGVQLFDQEGKPLNLVTQTECVYDEGGQLLDQGRVYYPWTNGSTQLQNVVPVPSVIPAAGIPDPDPLAFQRKQRPSVGQFPLVSVPPVSLPGLKVSKGVTPPGAVQPGARPQTPINGIDEGC